MACCSVAAVVLHGLCCLSRAALRRLPGHLPHLPSGSLCHRRCRLASVVSVARQRSHCCQQLLTPLLPRVVNVRPASVSPPAKRLCSSSPSLRPRLVSAALGSAGQPRRTALAEPQPTHGRPHTAPQGTTCHVRHRRLWATLSRASLPSAAVAAAASTDARVEQPPSTELTAELCCEAGAVLPQATFVCCRQA